MTTTRHELEASMVLPTFYRPVGRVFADDFEDVQPWPVGPYTSDGAATAFVQGHGPAGGGELWVDWTRSLAALPANGGAVYHEIPAGVLVVGRSYSVTAHAYNRGPLPAQVRAGLVGVSSGATLGGAWVTVAPGARVPIEVFTTFTGVALSGGLLAVALRVRTEVTGDAHVAFTDVVVDEVQATTTLDLHPTSASITLDESWSPYVRASLTCPIPPRDALDKFDPRKAPRVRMVARQWDGEHATLATLSTEFAGDTLADLTTRYAGQTLAALTQEFGRPYNATTEAARNVARTFDLHVRMRRIDYVAGTMTLELASDELLLQDYGRWETTTSALTPVNTTLLTDLVRWALSLIGASLDPSATPATIDPTAIIWNLGESLWSFLDGHVRSAGLRLWCDETRTWRLTPPLTGASGTLALTALTALEDEVTRDGDYADVVTLKYEWLDSSGAVQTGQGNHYGTPFPTLPKHTMQTFSASMFSAPAGAALALWKRTSARGRNVRARAVNDYTATPGQAVVLATPTASISGAMVQAVTWDLPSNEMTVTTRDATL